MTPVLSNDLNHVIRACQQLGINSQSEVIGESSIEAMRLVLSQSVQVNWVDLKNRDNRSRRVVVGGDYELRPDCRPPGTTHNLNIVRVVCVLMQPLETGAQPWVVVSRFAPTRLDEVTGCIQCRFRESYRVGGATLKYRRVYRASCCLRPVHNNINININKSNN